MNLIVSCVGLTGVLADLKLRSFVNSDLVISSLRRVSESSSGVDVVGHTDEQSSYNACMHKILVISNQLERCKSGLVASEKHVP